MSSPTRETDRGTGLAQPPRPYIAPRAAPDNERTTNLGRRRQKISLACEECRAKKIRCDGVRPQCMACRRKGTPGHCLYYQTESSRASNSKSIIRSLQDRLAQLEGRLSRDPAATESSMGLSEFAILDGGAPSGEVGGDYTSVANQQPVPQNRGARGSLPQTQAQCPSPVSSTNRPRRESRANPPTTEDPEDTDQPADESAGEDASINAMGMAALSPSASGSREFYGQSSAASFFSHIQLRLHPGNSPPSRPFDPQAEASRPGKTRSMQPRFLLRPSQQSDDFHLPPRHAADDLVNLYRKRVHCLYPYIHWPTLIDAYKRLWMSEAELESKPPPTGVGLGGPHCSSRVFYCALNVMFALAVQFSVASAQEKRERAQPFARRARHLLRLDYLDHGDISLVQALLIMAHYLQSTNLPTRCWNVTGVALRMAQGLGLHLDIEHDMSPLLREMRKRVWYGCTCLDVVLAMTFGRPTLNSCKSGLGFPGTLEEESPGHGSPNNHDVAIAASTATFFTETTKLYAILENILSQVYDPWKENEAGATGEGQGVENSQQLACLVALDAQLGHFEATMPDSMQGSDHDEDIDDNGVRERQRNVLRTRLLHCRIMLYRPPFVRLCQKSKEITVPQGSSDAPSNPPHKSSSRLPSLLADRCSISCVENAQALVEHINATSQGDETGAPWFNAYYVYHAAMVLALAGLCPPILQQLDRSSFCTSWRESQDFVCRAIEHDPQTFKYLQALREIDKYLNLSSSVVAGESPNTARAACEIPQGEVVNHILNTCLEPSLSSWLDEPLPLDSYSHFGEGNSEQGTFRDDSSAFGNTMFDGGGSMNGGWPGQM